VGVPGVVQLVASSLSMGTGIGGGGGNSSAIVGLLLRFVEGEVMEEYIDRRGRLGHLLSTIAEMKKRNVAHLDVKPDNILATEQDRKPVLFDFGTARPCNKPTSDDLGSIFARDSEGCEGAEIVRSGPFGCVQRSEDHPLGPVRVLSPGQGWQRHRRLVGRGHLRDRTDEERANPFHP